jgi:hypothetical protein
MVVHATTTGDGVWTAASAPVVLLAVMLMATLARRRNTATVRGSRAQ